MSDETTIRTILNDRPELYSRNHNYRTTGLKNNSIEKILELRERQIARINDESIIYVSDEKSISK